MPKTSGTRRDRAANLLELIKRGPAHIQDDPESLRKYQLWVQTWVTPEVTYLVPELRPAHREGTPP